MQHLRGFTLVELAIVLVIIGLIVGGVLAGQMLIRSAEIRKHVTQLDKFNAATNTFRLKYACLPGDCKNASSLGFTGAYGNSANQVNGNGDGLICAVSTHTVAMPYALTDRSPSFLAQECQNYWRHLSDANLIEWTPPASGAPGDCNAAINSGYATPSSPLMQNSGSAGSVTKCGGWLISDPQSMNRGNVPFANNNHEFLNLGTFANYGSVPQEMYFGFRAPDAFAVDSKIDDGLPDSGVVHAVGGSQDVTTPQRALTDVNRGAAGTSACIVNTVTPNPYNTSYNGFTCNLAIQAGF